MSDESTKLMVILLIGLIGGLYFVYVGARKYLLVQKIKNTPLSKADSAAVGLVELVGKMGSEGDLPSPISGVRCGYWRLSAEYYRSGRNSGWYTFYYQESGKPFYLEDDTGSILVDPSKAEIDIPLDSQYGGYISGVGLLGIAHAKIDDRVLKFIDSCDASTKANFMVYEHQEVRVYESYIAQGDSLYVLGTAMLKEGAQGTISKDNLIISKGNGVMIISDSDESKIVSKMTNSFRWEIFVGTVVSGLSLLILLIILNI